MRSEEELTRRAVWTAVFVALAIMAQLVASRAIRDGFFLTHFPASDLPKMMIAACLLSVTVVFASGRALRGIAPAQSVPWLFALSAFLFVIEWLLTAYYPAIAAVTVYLHVVSISLLVASGFWSVVNERFDPYTAKLSIGRIGGGATLGGVLGGVAAWGAAQQVDVATMLLTLAVINTLCAVGVKRLGVGSRPVHSETEDQAAALSILAGHPYLRNLALLVISGAFCQACYEYVFKSSVAAVYTDGPELVSFFALFYMGLNIVTFLVQNLLTRRVLTRYGLTFTVGSLPGTGAVLGVVALLFPGLTSAMIMRGGIGAAENSIFRSGYELLYTPVLPDKKRPTKTLIDVGGEMSGGVLGASAAFLVLATIPGVANTALILAGIAASIAGLYLTRRIRLGYVQSLADSLEAEHVDLEEAAFGSEQRAITPQAPPTLEQAFAQGGTQFTGTATATGAAITRAELQEYLKERDSANTVPDPGAVEAWCYAPLQCAPIPSATVDELDALTSAIAHLRSGDPELIGRVLTEYHPLPRELIEPAIHLLAVPAFADQVQTALQHVAPVHLGALFDTLRGEDIDLAARRRVCRLLGHVPTQRCVDGLLALIDQVEPSLRLRIASSLLRMRRNNPELNFDRERIFEVAEKEAYLCRRIWFSRVALDPRISATPALESSEGRRVVQGFTFISTLLVDGSRPATGYPGGALPGPHLQRQTGVGHRVPGKRAAPRLTESAATTAGRYPFGTGPHQHPGKHSRGNGRLSRQGFTYRGVSGHD